MSTHLPGNGIDDTPVGESDLIDYFREGAKPASAWRVGAEFEKFAVGRVTGRQYAFDHIERLLAAHIPGVAAIESNGRQYCPEANAKWDEKFPGVFTIRDGTMNTAMLNGPGLGAVS